MEVTETAAGANAASPATADALTPPVNDGFNRIDPSVDNVSDIDGPVKGGETKTADAKEAEAKVAADKAATEKADLDRFDKHPRFQELIKERDAFKLELASIKGKLEVLTPKQAEAVEKREEKNLPFKDITKIPKEQLLEWQEEDPVGYAANLYQQMLHETRETIKAEAAQTTKQTSVKETYETYAKENPDFVAKWNAGEIQKFMDANPVIAPNAIAAHMAMSKGTVQSQIDKAVKDAVDKAVKETEARVTKNFQAKRNAEVISDGGAVKADGVPDELKNPDKYGGTTATLALRLGRLRQAAAGG